jgi:UDP-4-amino-4,6-dideoxy-N-acetyl-beta-L-altrosamine N-acetyltransferase
MHPFPITEIVEKKWYRNIMASKDDKNVYFTITRFNDEPIGFLNLSKINHANRNCYLGIVIGESESQNKGFGKEALSLAIKYAFDTLNLKKISLEVIEYNEKALKIYSRFGFVEEGRLKQHYFAGNNYLDVLILSVFKEKLNYPLNSHDNK